MAQCLAPSISVAAAILLLGGTLLFENRCIFYRLLKSADPPVPAILLGENAAANELP
jgi:hypothetical protein